MTNAHTVASSSRKPLRLWPGVVGGVLLLLGFVVPVVVPDLSMLALLAGVIGAVAVIIWWVFFSRARWSERLGALAVIAVAVLAISRVIHISIAGAGMGMMFPFLAIETASLALVVWAVATRNLSDGVRLVSMVVAIVLGAAVWTLVRTDGISSVGSQFAWRWTPTAEERLLAQAVDMPTAPPPASAAPPDVAGGVQASGSAGLKPGGYVSPAAGSPGASKPEAPYENATAEWPGFRGPQRDGVVRGVRINTDWSASPPVELWRRPIGPGWSSFAVQGDLLYTQEQRGDVEIVACYRVSTGKPVWMHRDTTRFYESNGGAGPRGTPTLSHGRVYTFGATGILNVLDAGNGAVVWSRNAAADTKIEVPMWGFSSSPLVVNDIVVVATAGTLAAYDLATGNSRWTGPKRIFSYSSPHLATIDGVGQILLLSPPGAVSVAPADGAVLWEHTWDGGAITQPALTAEGDIVINSIAATGGQGIRRLSVKRALAPSGVEGWTTSERWTSTGLKPYFSDFVIHKGHAYGFDGSILASIDLADGKRKWKGGRYGDGQLILMADQDVLLVLSEEGDLALVSATPDKFTEITRFPAIEGKTWNHPVVVGDVLLVRNGEEMAAFRLKLAGR